MYDGVDIWGWRVESQDWFDFGFHLGDFLFEEFFNLLSGLFRLCFIDAPSF